MSKCALVFTNLDLYDPPQERIITKEKENKKIIKKIKPNKLLLAALSVAFSIFGAIPSLAADTPPVPTLDKLHNAGTTIPDTDPPQIYPESAYTYTPADAPGTNTITRFEKQKIIKYYDPTTGKEIAAADRLPDVEYKEITTIELVPKYYTVTLKQTEYGYKNAGGETKTFTVQTPSSDGTTDAFSYTINYYTDPARLAPDRITTNQNGADINNDFVEKSTTSYGGAIYNDRGTIGDITGDFIGNYAQSNSSSSASGGAIRNYYGGTIGNITANFISNYVYSEKSTAKGGAINNLTTYGLFPVIIGNITGDFIGNYAQSDSSDANGGAIYNYWGEFGNITGDFIGNYAFSTEASPKGGAIYNEGTISNITGDFIGNYAKSNSSSAYGGAIYNYNRATIDNITGDFIGNYVSGSSYANGGAIYNSHATIGDITGDYINNYAYSSSGVANGGAIYNYDSNIGNIMGDFVSNHVFSSAASYNNVVAGGAIFNSGEIGNITGDFIGNFISDKYARGGAIYNYQEFYSASESVIGNITGNFIGNYTKGSSSQGGAIYNYSKDSIAEIGNINADFIGNHSSCGGAIYNYGSYADTVTIGDITGDFIGNYAQSTESYAYGGAIYNHTDNSITTIGNITGDFIGNYSSGFTSASGGAIYNYSYNSIATIGDITGDFIGNYAQSGSSYALGGAIYNYISSSTNVAQIGLTNNNFLNNHASGNTAKGGAIFTNYDLTLNTDNANTLISGNYTESNGVKDQNAIYVANYANSSGTIQRNTILTLKAVNNGKIQIDDKISGGSYYQSSNSFWETSDHAYNLALTGDGTGTISLYNDVTNANVTADNVTVDLANNDTHDYNFVSMTDNGGTKYNIDVDMTNKTSDTISTINNSTGVLNINNINFMGGVTSANENVLFQIIKNDNKSSTLQIDLDSKYDSIIVSDVLASLTDNVSNTDKFHQNAGFSIVATDTLNDSLKYFVEKDYDTLQLINTKTSSNERNFNFVDNTTYVVTQDLGTTSTGTLNINGQTTGSKINAANHTMFDLQNTTTLNINNTTIENAKDYVINAQNTNATVNLTNTSIKNTQGTGVISNTNVNIKADGQNVEFADNSVSAINMQNSDKTLTLNTTNNGSITLNDKITGTTGYNVNITGTGTINLYNQLENADVNLQGGNINLSDGKNTTYVFNTLNSNANAKYSIDVDMQNNTSDKITTSSASNGTITIESINYITTNDKTQKYQILNTQDNNLQLAIGDKLVQVEDMLSKLTDTVSNTDNFDQLAGISLATTNTTNDSIIIQQAVDYDTLQLINTKTSSNERNFNFVDNTTYVVTQDLGTTSEGILNINGQTTGSKINASNHTMFDLQNTTTLNINNTTIENAKNYVVNAQNANSTVNLTNTSIKNTQGTGVISNTNVNIKADGQNVEFADNSVSAINMQNSDKTLTLNTTNNGSITLNDKITGTTGYNVDITGDNTGIVAIYNNIENANVSSDNVTIDLANNDTHDYNFVSMTAGENTKLNLDINLIDKTSDTITTQNESTGTLIVSTINTIGSTTEDAITVQVIKNTNQSSNLQLELGSNIQEVDDTLANLSNTLYNDELFTQQGGITLTTTNTTNDSIKILKDKIYDTLDIITTKESNEERNFNFRTTDNYIASKDLDTTSKGTLNINGIGTTTPSTIDANKHTMFDLQNETTLNISNTSINNAKNFAINAENINSKVNLTNASFKNTDGTAIKSNVDINITADAGKTEFSGNTQAVQMNNADKTITMNAINQGEIILNDTIDGTKGYKLALTGDDKSKITINNNISNADISLNNTNIYLSKENVFDNSQSLTLNSGNMYLNNDTIGTMHITTLNLTGTTNLSVDVDLENESMDRITADTYNISDDAIINVNNLNLISTTEKNSVKILFADEYLANNVEYTGESPISYKGTNTIYSPIYKYDVNYSVDENDHQGFFTFVRGSTGTIDDFNPAVTAPSVATQAGAYTTQLQTFNYAFQHADTFMNIPYLERVAMKNNNRYALSPTGDATDVGTFSPLLTKEESSGFWVKPYASFENIPLNNGPKVSNINYGTLIGYDTNLTPISKGWERVLTGYVGYNGASQRYSGVDAYQNGGILGSTATFYKGNFFNATTLSVGATAGDATTMYGTENYTMLLAGIGNKTGYNFEFKEGKIILQPSLLISYTFVNTFDYTNGAGVRIKSDPLNAIQLAPGIKLIGNTENGWQPYLSVAMVWNLLDDSKVTANDVRLPEMSIDPYVQYGVGVQKRFNDKFMAFGQAMIHNGGRNGLSLSAGFRWKVGKEK